MSKESSASKIKLNSIDSLFGNVNTSNEIDATKEEVIEVNLSDLHTFKNHPFRVVDDEKMEATRSYPVTEEREHVSLPDLLQCRYS